MTLQQQKIKVSKLKDLATKVQNLLSDLQSSLLFKLFPKKIQAIITIVEEILEILTHQEQELNSQIGLQELAKIQNDATGRSELPTRELFVPKAASALSASSLAA